LVVGTDDRHPPSSPALEVEMHSHLHIVVDHAGRCANREFAALPHVCPVCHHQSEPYRLAARSTDDEDTTVDFAFQCSRQACRRVYVASYHLGSESEYELDEVLEPWQQQVLPLHV
jgi:hypothetical protein